ncbi:hypothetical protein SAMN04487886_104210 [Clostridium sp. DSM 8431]|uniref:hypothetical protein n=1 Tax=Clostridium sp. DSM 8431 TaxID=1761781 RepID=UPI0008E54AC8|nr:hypothetical protein [Clostridium sp. DSM 8431]SFU50223.1 hypothetical protein SAMN04487886_104210 [Clostridium sp. DSM 8431]
MVLELFYIALFLEIVSLIFAIFRGRGIIAIAGTNCKLKSKIEGYNMERVSKSISNFIFICGLIITLGIIISS